MSKTTLFFVSAFLFSLSGCYRHLSAQGIESTSVMGVYRDTRISPTDSVEACMERRLQQRQAGGSSWMIDDEVMCASRQMEHKLINFSMAQTANGSGVGMAGGYGMPYGMGMMPGMGGYGTMGGVLPAYLPQQLIATPVQLPAINPVSAPLPANVSPPVDDETFRARRKAEWCARHTDAVECQ